MVYTTPGLLVPVQFFKEFRTSVLMDDFNLPDVSCEYYTADRNRCRRFLKHLDNSFLAQFIRQLTRKMLPLE